MPLSVETTPREQSAERPRSRPEHAPASYYPLFDYLRITLALGVFFAHARHGMMAGVIQNFGNFCVQIFFALSGYLIGGILRESKPDSLPRFYFNRSIRIWVPYFIAIALLAAGCVVKQQPVTPTLLELFFDKLTFTYNFFGPPHLVHRELMPLQGTGNHFWSICVEEQFYLVAPLIIVSLARFSALGILAVGGLASLKFPGYFASITLGVLLALSEGFWGRWHRRAVVLIPAAAAVLGLGWLSLRNPSHYELIAPFQAVLIVALCSQQGNPGPAGAFLGGISYPLYLNHWIGLFFLKTATRLSGNSVALGTLVALAIALGVSSAHYLAVDRVLHRRRAAWFTPKRGIVCAVCGFTIVLIGFAANAIWFSRPVVP